MSLAPHIDFCNALLNPIALVDAAGRIVFLNLALQNLLGYSDTQTRRSRSGVADAGKRFIPMQTRQFNGLPRGRKNSLPYLWNCKPGKPGVIPVLLNQSLFRPRPDRRSTGGI